MRIKLPSLYLTLEAGQPVTIAGAIDTDIRVLEGRVWLTEEGVAQDQFLFPGTAYRLHTAGRVVLDSDEPSRIELQAPVSVQTGSGGLGNLLAEGARAFKRLLRAPAGGQATTRGYQVSH